jgi:hypothetical protein
VGDVEVLALDQDMTLSRDEFLRSLPRAVDEDAFRIDGAEIRPLDPRRKWRIVLEPLRDLAMGAIVLPRHRVRVYLTGCDAEETARFIARFELYFRRGGG